MTSILTDLIHTNAPYIVGRIGELANIEYQLHAHNAAIFGQRYWRLGQNDGATKQKKVKCHKSYQVII